MLLTHALLEALKREREELMRRQARRALLLQRVQGEPPDLTRPRPVPLGGTRGRGLVTIARLRLFGGPHPMTPPSEGEACGAEAL